MLRHSVSRTCGLRTFSRPNIGMNPMRLNNKGFTLVELVMAMGSVCIITAAATGAIAQIFHVNRLASSSVVAVRQVQNAGFWVSRDSPMAQLVFDTDELDDPREILQLIWTDWESNETHDVLYRLEDGNLWRHDSADGNAHGAGRGAIVARNIDPTSTSASFIDTSVPGNGPDTIVFNVKAVIGQTIEVRSYEIGIRTRMNKADD
jgi:hypothetical protein